MATIIQALTRPPTLEKLLELPGKKPALAFEDGEVPNTLSPKGEHGGLQFELASMI